MDKISRLTIFILILIGSLLPCLAQETYENSEPNALLVSMHDGRSVIYALHDMPTITFDGDAMVFTSANYTAEHKIAEVKRYAFVYDPAGVADAINGQSVARDGDYVMVKCQRPGATATLYNASGQLVASATADDSGMAQLSLAPLPAGVYLLTFDGNTSKIIKR